MAVKKESFLDGYKANFNTLEFASKNRDLALMECFDTRTNKKVAVIVAVDKSEGEDVDMVPLAMMLEGNPYEYLQPPDPEGGFKPLP